MSNNDICRGSISFKKVILEKLIIRSAADRGRKLNDMKTTEICIEIDEDVLKRLKKILLPMGLTPEFVAEQFIRFCADPKNAVAVRAFFDEWINKKGGIEYGTQKN